MLGPSPEAKARGDHTMAGAGGLTGDIYILYTSFDMFDQDMIQQYL